MRIRKPLQDKIILGDIVLGVVVIGNMIDLIYTPTWVIVWVICIVILLEILSRLIRQTQIANIWKLVKDIVEKSNE